MTVHRTVQIDCDNQHFDNYTDSAKKELPKSNEEQELAIGESGAGSNNTMTNSKRARKKRREAQQEFNHSWMVGALKGHTAPVQDINFSSNGKFLASCAEDCGLAPEEKLDLVKSSKSKTSASSSLTKERENRTPLSRRQRKNRTRAPREQRREHRDRSNDQNVSPNNSPMIDNLPQLWFPPDPNPMIGNQMMPLYLNSTELYNLYSQMTSWRPEVPSVLQPQARTVTTFTEVEKLLQSFVLTEEQLLHASFPVMHRDDPNLVVVCCFERYHRCTPLNRLNANAKEFVPGKKDSFWNENKNENDSGNGSGSSLENSDLEQESSSDSDKCSDISESSTSSSRKLVQCILPGPVNFSESNPSQIQRRCMRCSKSFSVDSKTGDYLKNEECVYHWGKRQGAGWECCAYTKANSGRLGCVTAKSHVWSGIVPEAINGPLEGYVFTKPSTKTKKRYGVYAIDCEMCFTKNGLELTKVSVVHVDSTLAYDKYVKPEAEIIDYNTRFSGVTAQDLEGVTTTLKDVQEDLLKFICAETIIVGHGLENDMRALKIVHRKAIDTSFAYNNNLSPVYRKSLKVLAQAHLNRSIQVSVHDSVEDAKIAMDLMMRKLQMENCFS